MDWEKLGISSLLSDPVAVSVLGLTALVLVAWLALLVARRILVVGMRIAVSRSTARWDDRLVDAQLFARLAHLAPALVVYYGANAIPGLNETFATLLQRLSVALIVLVVTLSLSAFLNATNEIYSSMPEYRSRPIKGYLQLFKIALGVVAAVVIVATLFDRSPLIFLSGLGAMTAVLLLVFRDTILSLVASVQLTSNDMIQVGDWIEMPQYGADGDVVDIALHTVKVQNWDKTITTIPTHKLIEDWFKNWRGMSLSGGRRIKRPIYIDMNTIRFLEADEIDHFSRYELLQQYIEQKRREIDRYNESRTDREINANLRRLTNVGTFQAYVRNHLKSHPRIRQDMTLLVRQLEPTASGLPIEIYCFTNTTDWGDYEQIQSDLMDHLLAVTPDFGLRAFQSPSGRDLSELARAD